jgi:hypothetical protein
MDDDHEFENLIAQLNNTLREDGDGLAAEIYEELPNNTYRVRIFKPLPGDLNPKVSIVKVLMLFDGESPDGEPLVQIVFDDGNEDREHYNESVYMSMNAPAIRAVLLHYS